MKKYILFIIVMALSLMSAYAQTVSVDDVTIKAGETKVVSINLNSTQTNIVSFQMDLTLPDGITINKADCELGDRIEDTDQELTIGKQPDGSIRLTSTSFALTPITGTSGEIVKLSLTASKDAKGGVASLKNIVLATSNSEKLKPANTSFAVKVTYTLTYKVDNEIYKTVPVEYGTAITPEADPAMEGYTFSGWSEIPATMPTHDVTITGSYTINKYKLTYIVDGVEYKSYEISYAATITPEAEPTKEGYTFSGWSEIPETMPAHDVTVAGTFSINSHTPYAVLSDDNTVLTFYYDDKMESRQGMDVYNQPWESYAGEIITVVFDESFANCTTLTSTRGWFIGLSKLKSILGMNYLKTDNVIDMGLMFYGCSSLTSLDLSSFNTDNVEKMQMMFYGCSSLTSLDLSSFKTDNVTNMEQMFSGCSCLKKIYVASGWTTINVKTGDYMFGGCSKLIGGAGTRYNSYNYNNNHASYAHIDGGPSNPGFFRDRNMPDFDPYILLSDDNTVLTFYCDDQMESRQGMDVYDQPWESHSADINTVVFDESFANCTTLTSTYGWFRGCSKLKSIMGMNNLKTDYVTDMGYMFYGCSCLTSLNLSSFKTDNVMYMPYMFENCENLTTIYVREEWNTSNVGMSRDMFSNCPKLVGGEGTAYDSNHTSAEYAHIDGGITNPGYFTYKDTLNTLTYMIDGVEYKSYRLKSGVDIIPEPKPTKNGYVFLGWDDIPATMPDYDIVITGAFYPCGDVNTDKDVNVVDVVDIARFVVGTPSESFVEILADINNDGSVNLGDAVVLINDIAGDQNFARALVSPDITGNDMLTLKDKDGNFSLCLNNERKYTAFQFDFYIPENADVSKMMLNAQRNQKHQLLYNKVEEGLYRVAALSTSNNEFNGNEGELLNIAMNGASGDEVSVRNIHFFDVKGNDYLFDDINGSTTTSVRQIDNGEWIIDNSIYDLQGRKRSTLQRGVNIVGSKKVIVK